MDDDNLPRTDFIRDRTEPDFYLTHVIWRNSHNSFQPETGIRKIVDGKIDNETFALAQHNCADFDFAEPLILRGLRKGWTAYRIAALIEWLHPRRRRRAAYDRLYITETARAVHDSSRASAAARASSELPSAEK